MATVSAEKRQMVANDWRSAARPCLVDEPLEFSPFLRPQVWGGDALSRDFGKAPASVPIGESWEVSGLPEHPSIVMNGSLAGQSLSDLWNQRAPELSGRPLASPVFPLFVKWLDCREYLSVQVHPGDAMAREQLGQATGKSEVWVVAQAEPTARVFAGLRSGVTRDELVSRLTDGTVADCLHSFVPKVGDCISLPAGTVHAAGGGVVFAEVQQPSDLTFRLFDWNRLGLDGQPRQLHLEMALRSITWPQAPVSPTIPVPLDCGSGVVGEQLLKAPAFELERYTLLSTLHQPHPGEMSIWMVLSGAAVLDGASHSPHRVLEQGSTVLLPAGARQVKWSAADLDKPCQLLCVRLPGQGDAVA
jgi:mannose-6-phosphate isomerase